MAGRDAFEAAIDDALTGGRDPGPERLVYADWLDERNNPDDARLAVAQRWMAERGKWPRNKRTGPGEEAGWRGWYWYPVQVRARDCHTLPRDLTDSADPGGTWVSNPYPTREHAEAALAEALARLAEGGES